jgi:preprotein translocase subunit SecD
MQRPNTGTASGTFEARPLIAPGQPAHGAGADPFAALHTRDPALRVPSTEDEYAELSATQQQEVTAALGQVDCTRPPVLSGTSARVVCERQSGTGSVAYLAGAPILVSSDVRSATALAPSSSSPTWTVQVVLTSRGADKWHQWTAAHNAGPGTGSVTPVQQTATPPCTTAAVPCADFVAFVVGGRAVSVPLTQAALGKVTQISGSFDRASATTLAHQIAP